MKAIWCMVWLLGALLLISSLDTQPDPPAVNPHVVNTVASCLRGGTCEFQQERLNGAMPSGSPGLSVRWIAFAWSHEPKSAPDRIALSGHAADPSPPAPSFLLKPSFRS